MFSLIITLVSIALVVALAVATIYFGGSSFMAGGVKASAATLVNQGAQIAAAGALVVSDGKSWPSGDGPSFTGAQYSTYLSSMPVPPASAYAEGLPTPAAADWTYYYTSPLNEKTNHFVLERKIKESVCFAVNRQVGFEGIPFTWDGTSLVQCFGNSEPYTFLYDPPGTTPGETLAAVNASVAQNDPGGIPGQKRKCPNGDIQTTVCPSQSVVPGGGAVEPPAVPGSGAIVSSIFVDNVDGSLVLNGTNLPIDGTATIANRDAAIDTGASTPSRVVVRPNYWYAAPATVKLTAADLGTTASGTALGIPLAQLSVYQAYVWADIDDGDGVTISQLDVSVRVPPVMLSYFSSAAAEGALAYEVNGTAFTADNVYGEGVGCLAPWRGYQFDYYIGYHVQLEYKFTGNYKDCVNGGNIYLLGSLVNQPVNTVKILINGQAVVAFTMTRESLIYQNGTEWNVSLSNLLNMNIEPGANYVVDAP